MHRTHNLQTECWSEKMKIRYYLEEIGQCLNGSQENRIRYVAVCSVAGFCEHDKENYDPIYGGS